MTNVIACIDGSSVSTAVSDYASWASLRLDAPLMLLHVLEKSEEPATSDLTGNIWLGSRESLLEELAALDEQRAKVALEQGRRMLAAAEERVQADGVAEPICRQRHGGLVETLAELEGEMRLLVLGKHQGERGTHIGSRTETVVRTMHRPILVCPPQFKAPERVMLAFDGSATTRKGMEMVAGSPLLRGLACHVVMVGSATAAHREQLDWAGKTLAEAGLEVKTALVQGDVEQQLDAYREREGIDLIVMGAYGHSVIRRFLVGSTTTSVIQHLPAPVLLLR